MAHENLQRIELRAHREQRRAVLGVPRYALTSKARHVFLDFRYSLTQGTRAYRHRALRRFGAHSSLFPRVPRAKTIEDAEIFSPAFICYRLIARSKIIIIITYYDYETRNPK